MTSHAVIPLESNPEIFTDLAHKIGLMPILGFHDVYSLTEPDLVALLPQPVHGLILLFPLGSKYEQDRGEQDSTHAPYSNEKLDIVTWFKQTIGNGCGLYAVLHILSNLPTDLLVRGLLCYNLVEQLKNSESTPQVNKLSELVETLSEQISLDDNFGQRGQTKAPAPKDNVNLHFVSFVRGKDNHIYELDGRRNGPIDLGNAVCTDEQFCSEPALAKKIQLYMDGADEVSKNQFAMMAIAPCFNE